MGSMQFTDADRDTRGFIRITPPAPPVEPPAERSLADLLPPTPGTGPAAAPRVLALPPRAQLAGGALIVVVGLLVLYALFGRGGEAIPATSPQSRPTAPPVPATAPAAGVATPAATIAPTPAPTPAAAPLARLERAVAAFAAPDGAYLGVIEAGRPYTPLARLGDAWTQIDAEESGRVWIRAAELAPDAALPDLATPTPRPVPTSPPAPRVIVREVLAPPAPTQCAEVSGGGVSVQRCGAASLEQLDAEAKAEWRAKMNGGTP
jgi:hypothetical protein